MPKKYPKSKKLEAFELFMYGLPVPAVHRRIGIPERTLYRWQKEFRLHNPHLVAGNKSSLSAKPPQKPASRHIDEPSRHIDEPSRHIAQDARHINPGERHNPLADDQLPPQDAQPDSLGAPSENSDQNDLAFIRSQLMKAARALASDIEDIGPDINIRSLALSRVLDDIQRLDQKLPQNENQLIIRHKYYVNDEPADAPPWPAYGEKGNLKDSANDGGWSDSANDGEWTDSVNDRGWSDSANNIGWSDSAHVERRGELWLDRRRS